MRQQANQPGIGRDAVIRQNGDADAMFDHERYAVWRCGEQGEVWQQLRIDDKGMNDYVTTPLAYNSAHIYQIEIPGTGAPFTFYASDAQGSAGDNHGFFVVDVYEK